MTQELKFEQKGTWVKLDLSEVRALWDSNESDYRKWPDEVSLPYTRSLLEHSKSVDDNQFKLELFFEAKGVLNKGRMYKEYFRGMNWPYTDEQLKYIEETIEEAKMYYGESIRV